MKFAYLLAGLFFTLNCRAGEIEIKTADGCLLSAYEKINDRKAPVLIEVHGLGSNRQEWSKFNSTLDKEGINYLAVDLRGHGKSVKCKGKKTDYKNFSLKDWEKIILDLDAAYKRLIKDFPPEKIIPAGASIGANSAAVFSENKSISKLILLSPGYEYAGLKPSEAIANSKAEILFSYSPSDKYSARSCEIFAEICLKKGIKCSFMEADSGHGVQIFDSPRSQEYQRKIVNFIKK